MRKHGTRRRLLHEVRRVRELAEVSLTISEERDALAARLRREAPHAVDLAEACAGEAAVTRMAPYYGLVSLEPAELTWGWDLMSPEGGLAWTAAIEVQQPLVAVYTIPCTPWSRLTFVN